MIYPTAKLGISFNKLKDIDTGAGISIGNSAASLIGGLWGDKNAGEGVSVRTGGEAAVTEGLRYGGMGFDIGNKIVPGIGGVVGGAVGLVGGAVGGLIGNNKAQKRAIEEATKRLKRRVNEQASESRLFYSGMQSYGDGLYAEGGEIPAINRTGGAVILGGKSHHDGGNDLVDVKSGEKIAETEHEELLLDIDQTNKIESLKGNPMAAGQLMKEIITKETTDRSGLFGGLKSKKRASSSGGYKYLHKEGKEISYHLHGKERIFSREATRKIVDMAMFSNKPEDIKKLGEFVLNEISMQDKRPPEYKYE